MLDFSRTWIPYIYLYGVGGGIFLIGMFIILRSRSLKPEIVRHKEWYQILIFGFLYYMGKRLPNNSTRLGDTIGATSSAMELLAM